MGDRVLSRVTVSESQQCAVATISFNFPIRAVSHFPKDHGDHVRIDLKPIETGRSISDGLTAREELRAPLSRKAGIQEIQYDGDAPTGPVLTVTFDHNRHFAIAQGADFRSLDITIADAPVSDACSGGGPRLRTGPETSIRRKLSGVSSVLHSMPDTLDVNAVYALNLLSQQSAIDADNIPALKPFSAYAAYAVRFEEDGVVWNRLRLGFFKTRTEAQKAADQLKTSYPDAWIVRTSAAERESVYQAWLDKRKTAQRNLDAARRLPAVEPLPENRDAATLVAEARTLMTKGDYARAIQLLTKATTLEESQASPEAKELLGVAREKNGQKAHAKAEYEEYLERYPDAEGAPRVRQRLAALLSQGQEGPPELREGKSGGFVTRLTASLSQYYQRDESTVTLEQPDLTPDPDKQVNRNALVSGADMTASVSNDRVDLSMRFSGAHTKDFMEGGKGDLGAVSAWFVEVVDSATRLAARIGRQTRSTGGVLGRFDGGLLSFDVNDKVRVNAVAGAPVIRSRDLFVDKHRKFAGGSVDVNQVVEGLDTTVYFIHQTVDGLVDRQAAGFEFRYVDESRSAFGLVDYDTFYGSLNLALFNGSWRLEDNTNINIAFDYRWAPALMTIDALQGQGVESIEELRSTYADEDIYSLAQARAARLKSGSINISRPLSEKFQVNAGVTVANMKPTADAGGVPGQPGTGVEAFYSAQVYGQSLLKEGDFATLGVRYDDMSTAKRYVIDLNTRYPFSRRFRIGPRMRISRRRAAAADQTQFTVKPSMRINYLPTRTFQLELEGGAEWTTTENLLGTETLTGYYVIAGYRLDF
ncbi:SPOR domain-containing protein [Hyphococcus luteus]|uniref:SPOR domain-containing protein n=1 Tax=Hyphococcus luteus TaxID=2058213 RepID=UPI0013FDEF18|nr:SPOR domain-containing protein [Marinicaulis flavus]